MTIRRPRPSRVFNLPKGFVVFQGLQCCPFYRKQFAGGPQLCGHLSHCSTARESLLHAGEMPLDRDPILVMDEEYYNDYLLNLNTEKGDNIYGDYEGDELLYFYLKFQQLYLSKKSSYLRALTVYVWSEHPFGISLLFLLLLLLLLLLLFLLLFFFLFTGCW
jgi:hypothetical protein